MPRVSPVRPASILVLALSLWATAAPAQPTIRLNPATVTFPEPFTHIGAIRELADGSVLVADPVELVLKHLDPAGRAEQISRTGQGPLEYQGLWNGLGALRGDSTLIDAGGGRWLFLAGARVLGAGGPPTSARVAAGGIIGGDTIGHVLSTRPIASRPVGNGAVTMTPLPDSAYVILSALSGTRADTIERARVGSGPLPLGTGTQALLFPDGWIAFAYPDPYHVEWRSPDGRRVRGPALVNARTPVDSAEKLLILSHASEERLVRLWTGMKDWPEAAPPFVRQPNGYVNERSGSLYAAPDGRLLILRTPDARLPGVVRYDVVDRSGALSATLTMPASERVVGFGPRSVYVSVRDADDVQRLQRHAWPPAP